MVENGLGVKGVVIGMVVNGSGWCAVKWSGGEWYGMWQWCGVVCEPEIRNSVSALYNHQIAFCSRQVPVV